MSSSLELALILSISSLSLALLLLIFLVASFFKRLNQNAQKLDLILTDLQKLSSSFTNPLSHLNQIAAGLKTGLELLQSFKKPTPKKSSSK